MSGSGIANTFVGVTNTVTVQARSSSNVNISTGGESYFLVLDNPVSSKLMTDHNNGTYSTTYTATSVGVINVSVYFAGSGSALLPGLAGEYFQNWDFTGVSNCNVDPVIAFDFGGLVPWPLRYFNYYEYIGIRWTG